MNLDCALVGTTIGMLGESGSTSKNPPSINVDKNSANCSTSIDYSTSSSTSIDFFSTNFSSSKSLIITNASVKGEQCLRSPCNVSSSPSPIVVAPLSALKISHSILLYSPKLSLLSQNIGGGLDASS